MWSKSILNESQCNARTIFRVLNAYEEICIQNPIPFSLSTTFEITICEIDVLLNIENDNSQVDLCYRSEQRKNVSFEISLLDRDMKQALLCREFYSFEENPKWNIPWTLSKRMLLAHKDKYLHNGYLVLQISVAFWNSLCLSDVDCPSNHCVLTTESEVPQTLNKDLLKLYEEKHLSDFSLVANTGETFPVHKVVLVSRSPVFRAMVDNNMQKKSTNSVNIPDVDGDTLNRLLIFAYSDNADSLGFESAYKLYFAADKYQMLSLRQKCATFMKSVLSRSNVCDVLSLADLHQDVDLKNSALDFVFLNDAEVIQSDEWRNLLANNPSLAAETLQQLFMHKLQIQGNDQK